MQAFAVATTSDATSASNPRSTTTHLGSKTQWYIGPSNRRTHTWRVIEWGAQYKQKLLGTECIGNTQ